MSRNIPAGSASHLLLSGSNAELLDGIRTAWLSLSDSAPRCQALVQLALIRMARDLQSARRGEVIEQIRREIDYREWCARMAAAPHLSAGREK